MGIFISTDPAEQYWNLYSYCGGDPINLIDPDGAYVTGWFMLGGMVIGGTAGGIIAHQKGGNVLGGILAGAGIGAASGALIGGGFDIYKEITGMYPWAGGIKAAKYSQRDEILKWIIKHAGDGFSFAGRRLRHNSQGESDVGSSYYRDRLIEAIHSEHEPFDITAYNEDDMETDPWSVFVGEKPPKKRKVSDRFYKGKVRIVRGSNKTHWSLVDYDGNPLVYDEAQALLHELLAHAIPWVTHTHSPLAPGIIEENIGRIQLKLKQRDLTKHPETTGNEGDW